MRNRLSALFLAVFFALCCAMATASETPAPGAPAAAATPKAKKAKAPKTAKTPADATKAAAPKARDTRPMTTHTVGMAAPLPDTLKPIFDGKSLDGWTAYPADSWVVKDDALASTGAGRGFLASKVDYDNFRVVFQVRHLPLMTGTGKGGGDHQPCVLFLTTDPTPDGKPDAAGGVQFQVPNGGTWDYRPGYNNGTGIPKGSTEANKFNRVIRAGFDNKQWAQVEILVNSKTGEAKMAVAQPVGTKAVEVVEFKDPKAAGRKGPFCLQMHNANLVDEYKDIRVEVNPTSDELITTK